MAPSDEMIKEEIAGLKFNEEQTIQTQEECS